MKAFAALARIEKNWRDSSAAMLIEMVYRVTNRRVLARVISLIEKGGRTGAACGAGDEHLRCACQRGAVRGQDAVRRYRGGGHRAVVAG